MSERKAYRVVEHSERQGLFRDVETVAGEVHQYGSERALVQFWPKDCPWRFEDFPMPGTEVVSENGATLVVLGRPEKDYSGLWRVPVRYATDGFPDYVPANAIPSIWNARKDAKDERVMTLLDALVGGCKSETGRRIAREVIEILYPEEDR